MFRVKKILIVCFILMLSGSIFGADVILNEYNAVDSDEFLNGGNVLADLDGGRASDSYFGRILGNGGDWFELVVITDHLDMRNWQLVIYENSVIPDETLNLTNHNIWANLRSGTIITVSEDIPNDKSYNPAAGDWWINVQARDGANGLFIEPSNFPVSSNNWQLKILNSVNTLIFGNAGEGVSPQSGVGNTEIFRLEADPNSSITANSTDYDDGKDLSTFGAPNRWGQQHFHQLRSVIIEPSTLTVLSPNDSEIIKGGATYDITWDSSGTVSSVLIEFSIDLGNTWIEVYPPNVGNSETYKWLVPMVDSENCLVRITNAADPTVYDTSYEPFTIYECELDADLTGDCIVDMYDLANLANLWLECGNPYDPDC